MEERILEFIGDLRRAEIRISTAEALDALGASAEVGLTDRETFKATLASTLIKEARDEETFNRIFNLYFLDLEALGEGLKKALGPEDPRVQDQLDQVMDQENLDLDELTELLMRGQGSEMEMAIREGGQGAGLERLMYFLQVGYFSRRISDSSTGRRSSATSRRSCRRWRRAASTPASSRASATISSCGWKRSAA